ncbi:RagB/SusD family nutrient uptake outer membrane protein [Botryobacter ruber]|uniref:RagB/SusD family nutrient uptake outer membrane protein n=1 Tax=Botryobacter ruber TaxID=2171629 RepID=UPI000E0C804C|nr:RagB/SusD family nutrient uptake outer membrane protein [Botryobacter ruber]
MTRNTTYILVLSALLLLTTTSCDKYLDLKPKDGVVRQEFWQTKEQVAAAVNGCYASLLAPPLVENLFLWGELRADMLEARSGIRRQELDIINVNIESTNPLSNWAAVYTTINYCNNVIKFAPEVLRNDNTFTQAALNGYIGEAMALRALMYFYLARTFGDVPLKLEPTASDKDEVQLPKSSQQDVLNQVVTDLKQAEQYVQTNYGKNELNKGRITKYAVNAMLADVYLWQNDYQSSIAECNKVINSGQYGLVVGDNNWFPTIFYEGGSSESIFEVYFNINRLNPFYSMFSPSVSRRFGASLLAREEIFASNPEEIIEKDIRGDGAAFKLNDGSIWKYLGVNSGTARSSAASYGNFMVYRYADILLMKAEALNELGQGQEALDIIEIIRTRANALPETAQVVEPDDKNGITDYILAERAREFAYEGKRWYDLLRNARRNNYERSDLLLNIVANTAQLEFQQSAITKLRDKNSHYLPVYFYELATNKKLVQNPFYQ